MNKMISLNEVSLIPAVLSDIQHRSDVNPYIDCKLPIFVSPMTCIVDVDNYNTFKNSKVIPIIPRGDRKPNQNPIITDESDWVAYSLEEFKYNLCDKSIYDKNWRGKALIDVANGHMKCIYDYVKEAKSIWGNQLTVMIGNIANPETYLECCKAGIDYCRIGIAGGSVCKTCITGIHTSIPWILSEIQKIKKRFSILPDGKYQYQCVETQDCYKIESKTKIIADGGINTIDKAIKCLALGADYVMMGKLFAQTEEACGEVRDIKELSHIDYKSEEVTKLLLGDAPKYQIIYKPTGKKERKYYGMASASGKKALTGKATNRNIEGVETWVPIMYTLDEFLNQFEDALRSCMSYCGAHNLDEFIGKVRWEIQTPEEFKSYYK